MRILLVFLLWFVLTPIVSGNEYGDLPFESIKWSIYSKWPNSAGNDEQPGLSGAFTGITNNKLIIAGGTNLTDANKEKEGNRNYSSDLYILSLDDPDDWTYSPKALPVNLAFGVSITLPDGVLFIGGSNEEGCQSAVFMLQLLEDDNDINISRWPSLPVPLTHMTGALVGNRIYVAGGYEDLDNLSTGKRFFVFDTSNKTAGWKSLKSWPGPSRAFAVSAGQNDGFDDCFYLFNGIHSELGSPIEFLLDAYEYNTRLNTWKKIDNIIGPKFSATGGVAFSSGANHIVLMGGGGDSLQSIPMNLQDKMVELMSRESSRKREDSIRFINVQILSHLYHPPDINKNVFLYHTITNTVIKGGEVNFPIPLASNVVKANGKVFIPGTDRSSGKMTSTVIVGEFLVKKAGIGGWSIAIMGIYFGILAWMGWFFSRKQRTTNDYFKGGGKMPWWVVGLSIYGTSLSSITYMAIPAKAYATDWSYLVYNFGMILAVPVVILLFIPFYRKLNITTAYEYLELRFNLAVRVITSVAFMIFQIGRMAIVLFLPSIAINVITGFDIFLCIALMGVISLVYTTMGGIEAVIWTDALQVIILFGGAIIALILISTEVSDGFLGIVSVASAEGKFALGDASFDMGSPTIITALIATFFANLTTYGTDQTMVQRYMTTPTQKEAVQSVWVKLLMALPGGLLFFFIGTALFVFYKSHPAELSFSISDGDAIFPWFIFTQMPTVLSGLLLSGILAACMSTASSSINSAATAYSVDIHFRFGWSSGTKDLNVARIASCLFGLFGTILALMMATWNIVSLWDEFIRILGLIMGSFGGLFLLGLLTKKANGTGAIIGIIASIAVQLWITQNHIVHVLLYVATGSLTCFIVGYAASLFTPSENKDISNLTISKP